MAWAVRTLVKSTLATTLRRSGVLQAMVRARRQLRGPCVHVLGFHRVVDDPARLPDGVIPALCIGTASFRRVVELAARRCEVLPLGEAAAMLAGRRPPPRRDAVVFTFDDAYRDVYLRARPVLAALGLPATVFVPTGLIGAAAPLLHDRLHGLLAHARRQGIDLSAAPAPRLLRAALARSSQKLRTEGPLAVLEALIAALPAAALRRVADALEDLIGETWAPDPGGQVMAADELRACSESGLELGAHTVDHVVLTREPAARVRRELVQPRRELEAIAGRPCTSFAYCNGLWSPAVVEHVRAAGYTVAVTTTDHPNRPGQDLLRLGRKVLWEGHLRGATGRFSSSLAAVHLHDALGAFGLNHPVDGRHSDLGIEAEAAAQRRA